MGRTRAITTATSNVTTTIRIATSTSVSLAIRTELWRLISPLLPVGAFHHSQGLEQAAAWWQVHDEASTRNWIEGLLGHVVAHVDLPVLARVRTAWAERRTAELERWDAVCRACRETHELRDEERNMGAALMRLLRELGEPAPAARLGFVAAFGVAAANASLSERETAAGYAWAWCESQTAAAVRLIPLGQSAGQRILRHLGGSLEAVVETALGLADEDVGRSAPGLAIASARHETGYTRLFRS